MKMRFAVPLSLAAFAAFAGPAAAMTDKPMTMKIRSKTMTVHVMTMDDGSLMYGLSKPDFERLSGQRAPQLMNR